MGARVPGRVVMRIVDLSQQIYQGMQVFPGHLKTVVWEAASHAETVHQFEGGFSFRSNGLLMSDHGPTHVDAIAHLDPRPEAPSIDEMPLETFFGPATCLDISHVEPRTEAGPDVLDAAVSAAGVEIREGDIVLFYTATYDRRHGTEAYISDYPGVDAAGARWIADRRLKAFGVDAPSLDNPARRTYPVHMMCRERGMSHWENLANLGPLVGQRFTFMGLPLNVRGGSGSPVRAVALFDDEETS